MIPSEVKDLNCKLPPGAMTGDHGFTVMAVSNIDGDEFCDVWGLNDDKILRNQYVDSESWLDDGNDGVQPL